MSFLTNLNQVDLLQITSSGSGICIFVTFSALHSCDLGVFGIPLRQISYLFSFDIFYILVISLVCIARYQQNVGGFLWAQTVLRL